MKTNKEIIEVAKTLDKHNRTFDAYVRATLGKGSDGEINVVKSVVTFTVWDKRNTTYNTLQIRNNKVLSDGTCFSLEQVADILGAVRDGSYMFVENGNETKV